MSRNLILSMIITAASLSSCYALEKSGEKSFVCEHEIGDIKGITKCVTHEYVTTSGTRDYFKETQEDYYVELLPAGEFSTMRTSKGKGDTFISTRLDKPGETKVDLTEKPFRVVQGVYLKRLAIWSSQNSKS